MKCEGLNLAKVGVVGSNPVVRSSFQRVRPGDMGNRTYLRGHLGIND